MRALLLMLVLCTAMPLAARELHVESVGASDAQVARLTARVDEAFEVIRKKTGLHDDGPVYLVVVGSGAQFARVAAQDGVGMHAESVLGYAMPASRRVVINLSGIADRQLEPIGVLRHEMAHLVLGSALHAQRPLWFEEGVAQYIESVALNELRENAGMTLDDYTDFADLDSALRHEARAGAAYAEAREVINLLVKRHGAEKFQQFLRALTHPGADFAREFEVVTGEPVTAFEAAWLEKRKSESTERWFAWLGATWWIWLFGITGLIAVGAVLLRRQRGKSQLAVWEDQEKHYPGDPEWSYHEPDHEEGYTPEDDGEGWKRR